MNPAELDSAYETFISDLPKWVPDGVVEVDMDFLSQAGLLTYEAFEGKEGEEPLPHYFHVIETDEKVTLFNHQFAVWIVPKVEEESALTIGMVALIQKARPHLEVVFSTKGVYNTPSFVMRILKYYLSEVIDTQEAISSIGKNSQT